MILIAINPGGSLSLCAEEDLRQVSFIEVIALIQKTDIVQVSQANKIFQSSHVAGCFFRTPGGFDGIRGFK